MIEMIFQFGGEIILVRIEGSSVRFGNTNYGAQLADISGLKLDKAGVEREFPDLIGSEYWREEAIDRFKQKIKYLKNEGERARYIQRDLKKHGYILKRMKSGGHR